MPQSGTSTELRLRRHLNRPKLQSPPWTERPKTGRVPDMTDAPPSDPAAAPQALFDDAMARAGAAIEAKDFATFEAAISEAEACFPEHPQIAHYKGLSRFEQKDAAGALVWLSKAIKALPENAAILHNLSAVQISLGQFDTAKHNLLRALKRAPDYAEAYHTLAGIYRFAPSDPLIKRMEALARSGTFSARNASFLCFALAKAYDDADQPDLAWPMLEQANQQMQSTYNAEEEADWVADIEQVFTKPFLADRVAFGYPSAAPVFVVGMPRSGTTLLESRIDAHPQVYAAGELSIVGGLAQTISEEKDLAMQRRGHARLAAALEPAEAYGAGLSYLNAVQNLRGRWFERCVDKLPDNSFNLGFIAQILPGARFVHVMRHPLDVMLSIYFQRFTTLPYGFRQADIVAHWAAYQRVMDHWRAVLPDGMLMEVRYENLVQDDAYAQERLWRYLDLPMEVSHVVGLGTALEQRTASRWQVKQPVYTTSREKFRKYEAHMSGFIAALGGMDAVEAIVADQQARCALGSDEVRD